MRLPHLLLAAACAAPAALGCSDRALHRMQEQPHYRPYDDAPAEVGGMAMRGPPPGTVPRQWRPAPMPLRTGSTDAGYLTRFPLPLTREVLARGQRQFDIYCATCHGLLGDGESTVAGNMAIRPPPSLHAFADHPPGRVFDVVTRGYGVMPAHAWMSLDDRWAITAYVKALQRSQRVAVAELPADVRERLMREAP